MLKIIRLWVLLCALILPIATLQAQASITVQNESVEANFPQNMRFVLEASSSGAEITEVQLLYGAERTEVLSIVDLPVTPGAQVQVEHEVDLQVYYWPPGTAMVYRWVIRDSAGNVLETEPVVFDLHDERFAWSERTERNVTVYWYEGGEQFGDELMGTTTRALDNLQNILAAQIDQPVRMYVYANNSDMRSALQANEVEWVGGQANTALGIIVAAIEPGDTSEVRRIIPHELSHQVFHQAVDNPYGGDPLWLNEGLAVYNQETADANFADLVDTAAREGRLVPLEALSASFPADPDLAYQSYAQSRSMVAYIIDTYGTEKMQELLAAFREATPVEEALQNVLGLGVDELDSAWRATLPAQEMEPALVDEGPQSAPADRFEGAPQVADPVPAQMIEEDSRPGVIAWIESLPSWVSLSLAALLCVSVIGIFGVGLLFFLRMVGVDK
jgi:hypothetical protein